MGCKIASGLLVVSVGVLLMLIGRAFRRGRDVSVSGGVRETDEEWRERIDRQEKMIDEMDRMREMLERWNDELKRCRALANEDTQEGYYYYLKGMARAEQAEAAAEELEGLIAKYEAEYGIEDA